MSAPKSKANGGARAATPTQQDQAQAQAQDVKELTDLCTRFLQCSAAESSAPAASSSGSEAAAAALAAIRKRILLHPMPEQRKTQTSCNLRGHVWQILLGAPSVPASAYLSLVSLGPCRDPKINLYDKIRGDCFRTFQADEAFWAQVQEGQLSRVLNAFVHLQQQGRTRFKTKSGGEIDSPFTYMQGINALCGVFLSCMTELDAFASLNTFILDHTPLYWCSSHIGANAGCKLVDQILAVVDPPLAAHLADTTPGAYVYAFHCVSSFCATIRPLSEVVKLWDFLLACGAHFNVLCVAAQVVLLRDKLLASSNPKSILDYRVWPSLDAGATVGLALAFLPSLPESLYVAIRDHATHSEVAERISGTSMHENSKDIVFGWKEGKGGAMVAWEALTSGSSSEQADSAR